MPGCGTKKMAKGGLVKAVKAKKMAKGGMLKAKAKKYGK